jgi:hypothetical protein
MADERIAAERWDYRVLDGEGRVQYDGQVHGRAVAAANADGHRLQRRTYVVVERTGPWKDYVPPAVDQGGEQP